MSSSTDFLPTREAELVTWTNSFSEQISAQATALSLTAASAGSSGWGLALASAAAR